MKAPTSGDAVLRRANCAHDHIGSVVAGANSRTPPGSQTSPFLADVAGSFTTTRPVAVGEAEREILAVALTAITAYNPVHAIAGAPARTGPRTPSAGDAGHRGLPQPRTFPGGAPPLV